MFGVTHWRAPEFLSTALLSWKIIYFNFNFILNVVLRHYCSCAICYIIEWMKLLKSETIYYVFLPVCALNMEMFIRTCIKMFSRLELNSLMNVFGMKSAEIVFQCFHPKRCAAPMPGPPGARPLWSASDSAHHRPLLPPHTTLTSTPPCEPAQEETNPLWATGELLHSNFFLLYLHSSSSSSTVSLSLFFLPHHLVALISCLGCPCRSINYCSFLHVCTTVGGK